MTGVYADDHAHGETRSRAETRYAPVIGIEGVSTLATETWKRGFGPQLVLGAASASKLRATESKATVDENVTLVCTFNMVARGKERGDERTPEAVLVPRRAWMLYCVPGVRPVRVHVTGADGVVGQGHGLGMVGPGRDPNEDRMRICGLGPNADCAGTDAWN